MEENGHIKELPQIRITWGEETKKVVVDWDPYFANFDFVLAILEMGKSAVEGSKKLAMLQGMQNHMTVAQQQQDIVRKLRI